MPPSADCPLSWLFLHGFIYVLCSVYERDQLCNLSAMFLFAMTCGWSYRRTVLQKNATSSGDSPHLQQDEERQFLIDPNRCRRALLIVAHPDDECMFFAPIVRRLVRLGVDLSLVSASNGNYEESGSIRRKELVEAARRLGVERNRVRIIDDAELQDDPNTEWPSKRLYQLFDDEQRRSRCDAIISFDESGVSGHANHCDLAAALRSWRSLRTAGRSAGGSEPPRLFQLQSVPLWRKYCSAVDISLSMVRATRQDVVVISGVANTLASIWAMLAHRSQLKWFRLLYLLTSRYMLVNTLNEVP